MDLECAALILSLVFGSLAMAGIVIENRKCKPTNTPETSEEFIIHDKHPRRDR